MAEIYIVSTPIGNLGDITYRAVEVLKNSDFIICEDTRVTKKLLNKYSISCSLYPISEFDEPFKISSLLDKISKLKAVSLVSDAGTPLLSDPGYKFIREAIDEGHSIVPIPGASAVLSALVVSSLPTHEFTFLGFLPKSKSKKKELLNSFRGVNQTVIFFESPERVHKTADLIHSVFGDIKISVSRELTKKFEDTVILSVSKYLKKIESVKQKGELTICFNPSVI